MPAARPVRMGVRVSRFDERASDVDPGQITHGVEIVHEDAGGRELSRDVAETRPDLHLDLDHFAVLSDGHRISVGERGTNTFAAFAHATRRELEEDLRQEMFETDTHGTRSWQPLLTRLSAAGIDADPDALLALPFVVEFDDDVHAELVRPASEE